jgi:hypothetical protein
MTRAELSQLIDPETEYTTKQAALLLGVDASYLRRLLGLAGQPAIKGRNVEGRVWLIDGASLRAWQERREWRDLDK